MKLLILFTVITLPVFAKLTAKDPYIRLMPPGSGATAGFVVFKNDSKKAVEIIDIKTKFAKVGELHTHKIVEGVMQMRKVDSMKVPAKGELVLKPHDNHLMFFGLKKDLSEGEKLDVILKLKGGEEQTVKFVVRDLNKGHHGH